MSAEAPAGPARYPQTMGAGWFLRRRGYLLYIVREFTAVPIAAWMVWLLVEIWRLKAGPAGYQPHLSTPFIVFSAVCLVFALWHSLTFLSLAGLIMRIPLGDRAVPGRAVAAAAFLGMLVASAAIVALLAWGGR